MKEIRYLFQLFFFLWSMLFAFHGQVYGQGSERDIVGLVKSADGHFLEKVSVKVKGTSIGTATDVNGRYRIRIPVSPTTISLVFSHKGYETKELETQGKDDIEVDPV